MPCRSATADTEELLYIAEHSDSTVLVAQDLDLFKKLRDGLVNLPIKQVILLSDEEPVADDKFNLLNFDQLMKLGKNPYLPTCGSKARGSGNPDLHLRHDW